MANADKGEKSCRRILKSEKPKLNSASGDKRSAASS